MINEFALIRDKIVNITNEPMIKDHGLHSYADEFYGKEILYQIKRSLGDIFES